MSREGRLEARRWAEILDQGRGHRVAARWPRPHHPTGVTSAPGGLQAASLKEAGGEVLGWGRLWTR